MLREKLPNLPVAVSKRIAEPVSTHEQNRVRIQLEFSDRKTSGNPWKRGHRRGNHR